MGLPRASRRTATSFRRRLLAEAQGYRCHWCGRPCVLGIGRPDTATVEHLVPVSRGGSTGRANCVMACQECNSRRGSLMPDEWRALLARRREARS